MLLPPVLLRRSLLKHEAYFKMKISQQKSFLGVADLK